MYYADGFTRTEHHDRRSPTASNKFRRWFLDGIRCEPDVQAKSPMHKSKWWNVMCLTGVDYFSTLGYQPGIAYLAAGLLSPIATLVVVILTLFGLVPLYSRVAKESPHGQGSISMLEKLMPGWRGKTLVLVLLGFAATDFIITITLSAADATAHIVQNPFVGSFLNNQILVTICLLAVLSAIFLKGFKEAIGVSVGLVLLYLVCNFVVLSAAVMHIAREPQILLNWQQNMLAAHHGSVWSAIGLSLLLFPKLALGMSGFETGVAVMPLVDGKETDTHENPAGRIENTRKLLLTAAILMAILLMISSVATTVLIPAEAFAEGGPANGRALAYLAHTYLGTTFGTIYDISTIMILWFAGASAMAGLLNLVPRYLPRYGMAPAWALAQRPLVVFFTIVSVAVTVLFKANVDAQAGAYATGVLVLITSAALAVFLVAWREGVLKRLAFGVILVVFVYTSIANMIERPEGLHIASFFIGAILVTSLVSRGIRSFELRIDKVNFDTKADEIVRDTLHRRGQICLLANRPGNNNYAQKESEIRTLHKLTEEEAAFIFLEVHVDDPSQFQGDCLNVTGHDIDGRLVLRCDSLATPNAIAAILLYIRDTTGNLPHAYLGWTEGNPVLYVFRYIFLGEGETAPVTREILREAEPNPERRPKILVG